MTEYVFQSVFNIIMSYRKEYAQSKYYSKSTMIEKIFPKKIRACHAIHFTYPLEVDIMLHIFSVIAVNILSESEF